MSRYDDFGIKLGSYYSLRTRHIKLRFWSE